MKLVEVLWADCYSHCDSPWIAWDELDKKATGDSEIYTVGYIFKDDDRNLTLTMSWHPDDLTEVGMAITIPKPMIKHVRELVPTQEPEVRNGYGVVLA
jgi:hypothetical protein